MTRPARRSAPTRSPTPSRGRKSTAPRWTDRKSTRLNCSHLVISYAVFCLKKQHSPLDSHLVDRDLPLRPLRLQSLQCSPFTFGVVQLAQHPPPYHRLSPPLYARHRPIPL